MTRRVERLALPVTSPGTGSVLTVVRYGQPGARPRAYLQGSLHADEIPGMLVLNHLIQRLDSAPQAVLGEVVVVPVANPLGLAQVVSRRLLGRYALSGAGNYNRQFPDLTDAAAGRLATALGTDAESNVAAVRAALTGALAALRPVDETDWLRHALLGLALDADIVLDLHCDEEALLHIYTGTPLWPAARDLSAQLGAHATLLAEESGGHPFDEALSAPWWQLARRFPGCPVPAACFAATVELRGLGDVDDALAGADADNLYRFLQRRGVLAGDPGALPDPVHDAVPLTAVDVVRAPRAGVVTWLPRLGESRRAGQTVAEIAEPLALDDPAARHVVATQADGRVLTRTDQRLVRPGDVLVKVVGREPLPHRRAGALLSD